MIYLKKEFLLVVKFNTFVLLCNVLSSLIIFPPLTGDFFAVNPFIDFYSVLCLQTRSSLVVG